MEKILSCNENDERHYGLHDSEATSLIDEEEQNDKE